MSNILSIIEELRADNSRLAKTAILEREFDNELLKRVILAALDPFVNYWQKKIPAYTAGKCFPQLTLGAALVALNEDLVQRKVTGTRAINTLSWILSNCSVEDAKVVELIIARDLKCGVDVSTVNKVWKNLVPKFEVQLAHKDTSGIKYPAYAQVKYDGMRCHLEWDGEQVTLRSRSGKEIKLFNLLDDEVKRSFEAGTTLDGELLVKKKNGKGIEDRKTGNGILNKAVKGTISKEEAERVFFIAWDIVDFTSTIPYNTRLNELVTRVQGRDLARIYAVDAVTVQTAEEGIAFYQKCIGFGHEGAVLKNLGSKWVPKRSKNLGKMKAEEEADLKIVGWEEGTGKNVGRLGALIGQTADGKLKVGVGTGFSDFERDLLTEKKVMGKIMTVKYNQIIKDKKSDVYSLFLPVFIEIREDKLVANKFEELRW